MTTNTMASSPAALAATTRGTSDGSILGSLVCRVLVPVWVAAGAAFKLGSLNPNVLPKPVMESVKEMADLFGVSFGTFLPLAFRSMIAVELICVGFMLFAPRLARLVAASLLLLFIAILVVDITWVIRSSSFASKGMRALLEPCGCFGAWSPPSIVTFAIDAVLLAGVCMFKQGPIARATPKWPVSGIATVASIVVGTGLAFGVPDKKITAPSPEAGANGTQEPVIEPAPPGDAPPSPPPAQQPTPPPAPPAAEAQATPWPAAPAKLEKTYWIAEKKAVGQRLDSLPTALQISRPMPEKINQGRWHLIFYRKDCDHCFEVMNKHFAGDLPAPMLAIEVPDSKNKPFPMPCKKCEQHTLPKGPDYVINTPLIITVQDGVIMGITKDVDKPNVIETVLNAGKPGVKEVPGSYIKEVPAEGEAKPAPNPDPKAGPSAASAKPFPPMPSSLEAYYAPEFEKWNGQRFDAQPFALLIQRPIPFDLNSGTAIVVFYRADCEHCEKLLSDHFAGKLKAPTLAVGIPDTDAASAFDMPCKECKITSLVAGPTYVVETPVIVVLKDGVVQCTVVGAAGAEDPRVVEACLPK